MHEAEQQLSEIAEDEASLHEALTQGAGPDSGRADKARRQLAEFQAKV